MKKKLFTRCLLALVICMTSVSCHASTSTKADSCLSKALGDSIANIIGFAKHINAFTYYTDNGNISTKGIKKLHKNERFLIKFLLSNPQMTQQDQIVYGHFSPCIGFELKRNRREKVYVFVDLGLGKWSVSDAHSKMIKRFDTTGYELLHFCATLYPNDEFITGVYHNRLSK